MLALLCFAHDAGEAKTEVGACRTRGLVSGVPRVKNGLSMIIISESSADATQRVHTGRHTTTLSDTRAHGESAFTHQEVTDSIATWVSRRYSRRQPPASALLKNSTLDRVRMEDYEKVDCLQAEI
jgi:hypothetical protein